MKKNILTSIFLLLLTNILAKDIFVASNGSDVNGNGTINKPYQTINKARLEAQKYKSQNVWIYIRGGNYYLDSPLIFNLEDSPNDTYKISYCAYNNETVLISGGRKIPEGFWIPDQNGIWKTNLATLNPLNVVFRQLWVDNNKAERSKNDIKILKVPESPDEYLKFDTSVPNGILLLNVTHKNDLEIWTNFRWKANILKIDNISGNTIITNFETPYYEYPSSPEYPQEISALKNAYEFIDEPGEWYYNKYTKFLYYFPLNNKNPNHSEIIFPVLEKIIYAKNLDNVEFNGLTFSHATWCAPNSIGYMTYQGSEYLTQFREASKTDAEANVEFFGCSNITLRNNTFTHLGAEAVCFHKASRNNIIDNNLFYDIAGTAIRIGNGSGNNPYDPYYRDTLYTTKNNIIWGNNISNCANEYYSHCGIWLGFVSNNHVNNNIISDLPYTGISSGAPYDTYAISPLLGANKIINNKISNVVNKIRDGGAIYNHAPNEAGQSVIKHNRICDMRVDLHIRGIYLDQGSSNFLVENNYGNMTYNSIFTHFIDGNEINNSIGDNNFHQDCSHWTKFESYIPEYHTAAEGFGDLGVRFVDVNHDSLKDMVYFRWLSRNNIQRGVYLNECGRWGNKLENSPYCLPYHLISDTWGDFCVQFVDFDGDGYEDMLYCREGYPDQCKAYRNTGNGWLHDIRFDPPIAHFKDGIGDLGVRYVDVNHDGLKDIVQHRWINESSVIRKCFLNTGNGWEESFNPNYLVPYHITADGVGDMGARFVDLNNDGFEDLVYWRWGDHDQKGAYINSGAGWLYNLNYIPLYPTCADNLGDLGVKFIDVNHDGVKDMIVNRMVTPSRQEKMAWLNQEDKWIPVSPDYAPDIPIFIDYEGGSQGVLIVDLNGDGYDDIVQNYWQKSGYAYLNNSHRIVCHSNFPSMEIYTSKTLKYSDKNNLEISLNPFSRDFNLYVKFADNLIIDVYTVDGILIEKIANNFFETGNHSFQIKTKLSPGIYLLNVQSKTFSQSQKIIF